MADLLSAASLLLAVIAVLYGLWYPEISRTLEIQPRPHAEDNKGYIRQVQATIRGKSVPLIFGSGAVVAVFSVDVVRTLFRSASGISRGHFQYDAVSTAFVLVILVTAGLCGHSVRLLRKLSALRGKLQQPIAERGRTT